MCFTILWEEFARWRAAFHDYPRHIWLARVEQEFFHVWHYGQYNFLDRLTHRRDPVSINYVMDLKTFPEPIEDDLPFLSNA